jgi:hypothetical protein
MRDGRSSAPPLPEEFEDIVLAKRINAYLGTCYTIAQVRALPTDDLLKLQLLLKYSR